MLPDFPLFYGPDYLPAPAREINEMPNRLFLVSMLSLFLTSSIASAASQNEFSYVDANGIRFAYLEEGTGPLVLLLHGYPETARSWTKVQHRLAAAGYRVVAPNMRGYTPTGLSRTGDYRVGSLGADALALIDALGYEQAVIVGHDWGASAAYAAATAAPAKVRGLVSIAIPHPLGIADDPSVLLQASHFIYYQLPGIRWWVARDNFSHIDRIYQSWSPTFDLSSHDLSEIKKTLAADGGVDGALGYYWSFGDN